MLAALAGTACLARADGPAIGGSEPPSSRPPLDLSSITGRDFAGTRLSIAPQRGPIRIKAQRAATWSDEPGRAVAINPTGAYGVERIYLRGDVDITLAYAHFRAARAVVWIEPLEESRTTPGAWLHQVAVYFDRLSDPAGEPGITPTADRILVTGVVDGPLSLSADALVQGRPSDVLVLEGERRFARFLRDLLSPPEEPEPTEAPFAEPGGLGTLGGPIVPGQSQPFEPNSPLATGRNLQQRPSLVDRGGGDLSPKLFSSRGIISFAAGEAAFVVGQEEDAVVVTDNVVVNYIDVRASRTLEIRAQRAVIFFEKGARPDGNELPSAKVRGIYVEGDVVATDGQMHFRAPRIYYDVQNNRALGIDAVFWTYDERLGMPLYVRAKTLRQTASQQVEGQDVTISASSFFEPQFSLAASRVTVTRERSPDEVSRTILHGEDLTPRIVGVPFFYWPSFTGDADRFPLREIRVENSSSAGAGIKTRWDLFGIFGVDMPGWNADLLLDGWLKRGPGIGVDFGWTERTIEGNLLAYMVPYDRGTDVLPTGARAERDGDFRGIFLAEHRWEIGDHWTLFLEAAHISDENFVAAYNKPLAETRREFTNAATIRYIGDNSIFTGQLKGTFNDFVANEYLLQSLGYSVNRTPEFFYARTSDDLLGGVDPGVLTWSHEYRIGIYSLAFTEPTAAEMGFNTFARSINAFGIAPGMSISDAWHALGLNEDWFFRADTRQEFDFHAHAGPVNITPFVVGRITAYDDGFSAFSPTDSDHIRLWGGGGVRADTTLQRIYDDADSRLLDIHRLRHIVRPSATIWGGATSRPQSSLPVIDERVESITDGFAARGGVTQVLQTQRGGPGRWRTVDMLRISTDVVWSSDGTPRESPIGRFFDYRPEYSMLGKFFTADAVWQATDSLALTFNDVYSFDLNRQEHVAAGAIIQHSADFSTFAELHYINARNATYVDAGGTFRITPHYVIGATVTYDTDRGNFQDTNFRVIREFEAFDLGLRVRYDNITSEVSVGVSIVPHGRETRKQQLRRLGRDQLEANAPDAYRDLGPASDLPPAPSSPSFGGPLQ